MKKTLITSMMMLLLGCGGLVEYDSASQSDGTAGAAGTNAGAAGSNSQAGAGGSTSQVEYLTRGELITMLASDLLLYSNLGDGICDSEWVDVSDDTSLCLALKMLKDADVEVHEVVDANGEKKLNPNEKATWPETWLLTVQTLGWIQFPYLCMDEYGLATDSLNAWYAAALCSRGLLTETSGFVTKEGGQKFVTAVKDYQSQDATRFDLVEILANRLLGFSWNKQEVCQPQFSDMSSEDMLNCQLVNFMVDQNLVDGFPNGQFKGNQGVNSAEYMKFLAESADLPLNACLENSCAGTAEMGAWYCAPAQAVCKTGVVDSIVPADLITRHFLTVTAIEMKKFLAKLKPQGRAPRSI